MKLFLARRAAAASALAAPGERAGGRSNDRDAQQPGDPADGADDGAGALLQQLPITLTATCTRSRGRRCSR